MLNRELGAESNWKLPHLSIPSTTAALIPGGRPAFGKTAALVRVLAVKILHLDRTLIMNDTNMNGTDIFYERQTHPAR